MLHNLFPQEVYLDKEQHRYFDGNGNEYMSFSKCFGFLTEKFDAEKIAFHTANRDGVSQEDVLNKWKKQTDEGTRIDKALKLFSQTGQILEEDADLKDVIYQVSEKYQKYHKCYEDLVIYNKDYRTAGEIDKLSITGNRSNSTFHLSDFKRFEGGMKYEAKGQKWLNAPFDFMTNSKYNRITFQASFYAWHFEKLTGRKCERLFVDMIVPKFENGKIVGYDNTEIPLAYLKRDIEHFLVYFKPMITASLEGQFEKPAF